MKIFETNPLPPLMVRLYHTRERLALDLAADGMTAELPDTDAFTVSLECDEGIMSLVYVGSEADDTYTLGLLAHESVHVMQAYMEGISEESPSAEFEAYVTQAAFTYLLKVQRGEADEQE